MDTNAYNKRPAKLVTCTTQYDTSIVITTTATTVCASYTNTCTLFFQTLF
jgi:hypothetical protein